ncbi:MAG TPA: sugar phosphate isomerase/epimerase family protein [Acidobacteriaceae bacterium]|nr:sugar phosphate isomerase/epimerase family protein [Acidobacteriaceae bacterium]
MIRRRDFLASLPLLPAAFASAESSLPANRNIQWALSSALWRYFPPVPFTSILDVMKETGFPGVRLTGFPGILNEYGLTQAQMLRELSRRNLHAVTISWNGELQDPGQRQQVLASAREAMKFLADFGADHLVVFSPGRDKPGAQAPEGFQELCARCNQIGELAGEMGFTAGLHNHMGQMVQTQDEVDRFMSMTDPKLFGLSPDTAHLHLAGCDVVGTIERYKHRIRFLDYKDARWTTPAKDWVQPNGKVFPRDSQSARFFNSIYDLGDGAVDFPGCHRVLQSVHYRGWICVDLDTARNGPLADFRRCGAYIVKNLQPIYM